MRSLALRIGAILVALGLATVAATSVSRVPALSGTLTTLSGQPVSGAFLAYCYQSSRFNFVDSLTYDPPGNVVRTDAAARYEIPGFLEIHRPLDSGLEAWIEWVYVPQLHHLFGPIARLTEPRPGLMEWDPERGAIALADLTDDPERWSQTIRRLDSAIRELSYAAAESEPRAVAPELLVEELRMHLRREYRSFMERHSDTPRDLPEVERAPSTTDDEWQHRQQEIRKAFEREPRWGQLMERLWPELSGR